MGRFYDPSFLAPRNSPPHAIKLDTFRYLRRLTVQLCIEDYKRGFFTIFFYNLLFVARPDKIPSGTIHKQRHANLTQN